MKWINVKDELPEASYPYIPGEWVLGWDVADELVVLVSRTYIDHEDDLWEWKDEAGDDYGNDYGDDPRITHWMTLPEGPGTEKE